MVDVQFRGTGSLAAALAHGARLLAADPEAAAAQAREILRLDPGNSAAHRLLGNALRRLGQDEAAEKAELDSVSASLAEPALEAALKAIGEGRWADAEGHVRRRFDAVPDDPAAFALLAEIAAEVGAYDQAERLIRQAIVLAPAFLESRLALARILFARGRVEESLDAAEEVRAADPGHVAAILFLGATRGQIGAYDEAIATYEDFLAGHADEAGVWVAYGHVLKTVGRTKDGIAAYRRALDLAPASGEAWWSLANLKTGTLDHQDRATMARQLERPDLGSDDRVQLLFASGCAAEEANEVDSAFRLYADGNRAQRARLRYDPATTSAETAKARALFTADFFAARQGYGDPAPDPIFVLGLPRAGSTLVEQILATHEAIEGTAELPHIPALIQEVAATHATRLQIPYPEILAHLSPDEIRTLGRLYLERAAVHRRQKRPFFIDKLPNNWLDIGFIQLILPNARIVDARRAPLPCCWSNFKQYFARGQAFSYDLADLGLYYRDYQELMAHYEAVLPGRIHRVQHEALVADPEAEVRGLLAWLGLAYDPACLDFHSNARAVRTASSEQVRRPINAEGLEGWRAFEPFLKPLKDALNSDNGPA